MYKKAILEEIEAEEELIRLILVDNANGFNELKSAKMAVTQIRPPSVNARG